MMVNKIMPPNKSPEPSLFQGCPDAVAVGIQQLRNAACELHETLQRKIAAGASLAVQIPSPGVLVARSANP